MFSIRKFWFDCQGGLSPSIAIIMMYLITVCGMGANAAFLVTQKMRLEGVADVIALEAMRGIRDTDLGLDGVRSYALESARHAAGEDSIDVNLLRDVTTIQFGQFDQKTMNFVEDDGNPEAVVVRWTLRQRRVIPCVGYIIPRRGDLRICRYVALRNFIHHDVIPPELWQKGLWNSREV